MSFRYLLLSIFIVLISSTTFAQNGQRSVKKIQIIGKVTNGETKAPLDYASISIFSAKDSTLIGGGVTNEKGIFSIEASAIPLYLEIKFLGFLSKQVGPYQPEDNIRVLEIGDVILIEDAENIEEVEVVAERSQMQLKLDKRVFNIGKDLANTGATASDILDNIPSVEVDVEGTVSLRGSQNVRILIDGKPSGMLGLSGSDALNLLQGDMIERVEVVTNPSSRYDAEGDVGIINIILKKDRKKGVNGSVNATVGYPHNYSLGANINYRQGKFNLFGNYSVSFRRSPGYGYVYQEVYDSDTTYISEQKSDRYRGGVSNMIQLGADYIINDFNTITVSGRFRPADMDNEVNLHYLDYDNEGNLVKETTRDDMETETKRDFETALNYTKTFKKEDRKFTMDFQWSKSRDMEESEIVQEDLSSGDLINQRVKNVEGPENWLIQTDYVHPFAKNGKFELGAKTTLRTVQNDYSVEELNNGEWQTFRDFLDDVTYQENIYAAYAMAGNKFGKVSLQGGVRAEYSDISVKSVSENSQVNKEYLNWFPSANLSYEINKKNTFQLSYSYRISRPWFRSLLPFSNYSDSRNFRSGNPDLNPTYTHASEIGYLKYWESGSLLSSFYYRYSTGAQDHITLVDSSGNSLLFPINLSTETSGGFEATINQKIFDWWRFNFNLNLFWFTRDGQYQDQNFDASTFRWNFRLNSQWELPKNIDIQANWRFRSPYQNTQSWIKVMTSLDLSISKELIKKKATLTFSARDVFNSQKFRGTIDNESYYRETEFQWRARQFLLSFNYKINQKNKGGRSGGMRSGGDDMTDF